MEKTRYKLSTGEIMYTVFSTPGFLLESLPEDVGEIDGSYSSSEFFVVNGIAVEKSKKPHDFCVFNHITKKWEESENNVREAKNFAVSKFMDEVANTRKRFVTVLPGQEMIYLAKEAEAVKYLALNKKPSDLIEFPLIKNELGISGETAYQIAQLWLYLAERWKNAAGQIEAIRLTSVDRIKNANCVNEVLSILKESCELLKSVK